MDRSRYSNDLSIQLRGEVVKELAVTEFLIANEGADPIRNAIEPLMFTISDSSRIVDASITYVNPDGRDVSVEKISDQAFRCDFALLNPDEYFYVKLVTDGHPARSDINCRIVAENLPPTLNVEDTGKVSIGARSTADATALVPVAFFLVVASATFLPLVALLRIHPSYFPFTGRRFDFVWWVFVPALLDAFLSLICAVLAIIFVTLVFTDSIPPRKRSFKRPRPYPYSHYAYIHRGPGPDSADALVRYPRD